MQTTMSSPSRHIINQCDFRNATSAVQKPNMRSLRITQIFPSLDLVIYYDAWKNFPLAVLILEINTSVQETGTRPFLCECLNNVMRYNKILFIWPIGFSTAFAFMQIIIDF
uniref:Uncharacterized protein n=1 Tax=Glossina brevipalpis TaxID=37001 RepID=A0A1A9X245_9MUSC